MSEVLKRSLPGRTEKNRVAAIVYWFYNDIIKRKPDATVYARHSSRKNPRSIINLIDPQDERVASYTTDQIGMLVWHLIDEGVDVRDLGIVTVPMLMYYFVNRGSDHRMQAELDKIIAWLKSESRAVEPQENFNKFTGWSQ